MLVLVWVALGVFVLAAGGGIALAAVRGLAAWRDLRELRRRLADAVFETTSRIDALTRHAAELPESATRLERARAQLQRSLTTARVLGDAAAESKALVVRVRGYVPRR